ncbi:MAG: hypothetical protein H0X00_18865, partial [Sporichthya sp.]
MDPAVALQQADRISDDLRGRPDPQAEADLRTELAQLCRDYPAVAEQYWLPEILEDLGRAYERLGRTDDALAAVGEAIEAGLRGTPDPRTVLGEINYRAGRREEAEKIWAALLAEAPNDWWLHQNVAFEKADGGEWDDALAWIDQGVRLALAAGDPDRLLGQMSELRHRCLLALGLPADELQERAESFTPADRGRAGSAGPPIEPPARDLDARVGLIWIPDREYADALRRWP